MFHSFQYKQGATSVYWLAVHRKKLTFTFGQYKYKEAACLLQTDLIIVKVDFRRQVTLLRSTTLQMAETLQEDFRFKSMATPQHTVRGVGKLFVNQNFTFLHLNNIHVYVQRLSQYLPLYLSLSLSLLHCIACVCCLNLKSNSAQFSLDDDDNNNNETRR